MPDHAGSSLSHRNFVCNKKICHDLNFQPLNRVRNQRKPRKRMKRRFLIFTSDKKPPGTEGRLKFSVDSLRECSKMTKNYYSQAPTHTTCLERWKYAEIPQFLIETGQPGKLDPLSQISRDLFVFSSHCRHL